MEKFVVIGTGFIGQYMIKGMQNVVENNILKGIAFGIKGHNKNVENRSRELGFDVSVNNTLEVLERENPSIIILSSPPEVSSDIVKNSLLPYFEKCRNNNIKLPDLYSFIPSPSADWICDTLGGDVNVVKILPNIIDTVCGYNLSKIGINYISYAKHHWSEERKEVLLKCMKPYGATIEINDIDSLVLLTGKITSHVCYEVAFTIKKVCDKFALNLSINDIGMAMRKSQKDIFENLPFVAPSNNKKIPFALKSFFDPFIKSWFSGLHKFTLENKNSISDSDAFYIDMCSFALNVFPIRYKTKDELVQDSKNAATKGGILERGIEYFYEKIEEPLSNGISEILSGKTLSDSFFNQIEYLSYETSKEAYIRSIDLTGKKK